LGAAVARAGLRARRDRRGGDRRHVALGWRGLDPRDGDRRVHHQHAHQRAAHPLGPAGVADRRHRRDRHPGGLSRHRPTAAAAVVNAVWDLWARIEGKPVWKLLVDMTPEQVVACIDFRYITDALTPDEALALLRRCASTKAERESEMRRDGFPAYTTSAGWLGYSDDKLRALCREAVNAGWTHLKMKVGRDIEEDVRRARIAREVLAVLLMAAKFGVPVCPHAGGVGLCEYVQHLSLFDYIAVSGSLEDRVLEYVDHLHEHFVDPVTIRGGRYMPPSKPGYSVQMK